MFQVTKLEHTRTPHTTRRIENRTVNLQNESSKSRNLHLIIKVIATTNLLVIQQCSRIYIMNSLILKMMRIHSLRNKEDEREARERMETITSI